MLKKRKRNATSTSLLESRKTIPWSKLYVKIFKPTPYCSPYPQHPSLRLWSRNGCCPLMNITQLDNRLHWAHKSPSCKCWRKINWAALCSLLFNWGYQSSVEEVFGSLEITLTEYKLSSLEDKKEMWTHFFFFLFLTNVLASKRAFRGFRLPDQCYQIHPSYPLIKIPALVCKMLKTFNLKKTYRACGFHW